MSKRPSSGMMAPDAQRALVGAEHRVIQWLPKKYATEEQLDAWKPSVLKKEFDWIIDVECVLAEDYSVFDAQQYSDSTQTVGGNAHARSISFKGTCPLHRTIHHSNNWSLINTKGYNTTLFICHHGNARRLIRDRLPFPVDE